MNRDKGFLKFGYLGILSSHYENFGIIANFLMENHKQYVYCPGMNSADFLHFIIVRLLPAVNPENKVVRRVMLY